MILHRSIFSFIIIFIFASSAYSQIGSNLEDYLKIKVFKSTRADVERIYGKPKNEGDFVFYLLSNGMRVSVKYTNGDCNIENELYNAPKNTVYEITYSPLKERPDLKKLISGQTKFQRRNSFSVGNHIEFYNDENGITITFDETEGGEGVMDIVIGATSEDELKYGC